MVVIDTVAGDDEAVIADTGDRAGTHVVLEHTQSTHQVITPDDVSFVFVLVRFGLERTIVFTIVKSFNVQAQDFSAAGVVPQACIVAINGRADPHHRPVIDATRRELW